jgi:hypothetical protein
LACQALGLLGNDKEWIKAFNDVVATTTSPQLRQLFVSIILLYKVAGPKHRLSKFTQGQMHNDRTADLKAFFSMPNLH